MDIKRLTISALLATIAISPAHAGNFEFAYTGDPSSGSANSPMSAVLHLTTSDTLNALGGYDILSASGTVDGFAVTGIDPNPNQPNPGSDGYFTYTNVLYLTGPIVDDWGIVVTAADNHKFNFGWLGGEDNGNFYYGVATDGGTHINPHTGLPVTNSYFSEGNATLAAVPEPASWAMMVAGVGLAGVAMRRRRTAVSFA